MQCFFPVCPIMRTPQGLAINGHHSLDRCTNPLDPLDKTRFKLFGIDERKDPTKRVMRGNTIWQIEQFLKKCLFRFPKFLNFHPSFCSANDSTDRQKND